MSFSGLKPPFSVAPLMMMLMVLSAPSYSVCEKPEMPSGDFDNQLYMHLDVVPCIPIPNIPPMPEPENPRIKQEVSRSDKASLRTQDVAKILDQLKVQGDEKFADILSRSGKASSQEVLDNILNSVSPAVDGAIKDAVRAISGGTNNFIQNRMTGGRTSVSTNTQTGLASGDSINNVQSWVQVFGQSLDQGLRDGVAGFEADVYGITVGADTEALLDDVIVGLAFTYAQVDVDSDNANNTQTDIDTFGLRVYGHYDLNDTAYLMGAIGYTYGDNEYTRYNVGGSQV